MKPHHLYRVSRMVEQAVAGKVVSFVGYRPANSFDIRRAIVREVNSDGSAGAEWLVSPHYVIPL